MTIIFLRGRAAIIKITYEDMNQPQLKGRPSIVNEAWGHSLNLLKILISAHCEENCDVNKLLIINFKIPFQIIKLWNRKQPGGYINHFIDPIKWFLDKVKVMVTK